MALKANLPTSTRSALALVVLAGVMVACDSTPIAPDKLSPTESRPVVPAAATSPTAGPGGSAGSGAAQSQVASVDLTRGAAGATAGAAALLAAPSQRVVYFDFDSFAIRDEYRGVIEGHARVLGRDKARRMVIEGHTDERGGREYNLALGQKRAESVLRSMTLLGATEAQLEAVSYGKERPAAAGSDEAAWAKNRRAELKDR
ncbi:MAG: peptidoglycan-associated lipoprotein Pal [Rubrivivax sp.]|nr:peptidoglycan-associated lipoprotein Pal [Rubrivivax sp.]